MKKTCLSFLIKSSSPLLKCLRRKKEHYSRLNDFSNVKLISSNIQAEIVRLNSSLFTSRFSNCKSSQLWNNIRSLVLVPTKRSMPNINVDALNKSFIYGPTGTPVLLPPLLNPSAFKPASNSNILPLLFRIKSNPTESSLWNPPLVLKMCAKELCSFVTTPLTPRSLRASCLHLGEISISRHSPRSINQLMYHTSFGQLPPPSLSLKYASDSS